VTSVADPLALYKAARASGASWAGFYNRNVRLDTPSGPVVVRIPIPGADAMDLRVWPEHLVLQGIAGHVGRRRLPRLLHVSEAPAFQIYEFVPGEQVDAVAPRGVGVPEVVVRDVVALFAELLAVPRDALPPSPPGWPEDGDTAAFARRLSDVTEHVHATFLGRYAGLFAQLGIPDAPLAEVTARWEDLHPRPFRLAHCDVHRKNMLLDRTHVVFLDWELALWADPVYDLAVHVHKMEYQPAEQAAVTGAWQRVAPAACSAGWEPDVGIYLAHERVKSAVVDTVRYTTLIASGRLTPDQERARIHRLAVKLEAAGGVWGWRHRVADGEVEAAVRRWASRARAPG